MILWTDILFSLDPPGRSNQMEPYTHNTYHNIVHHGYDFEEEEGFVYNAGKFYNPEANESLEGAEDCAIDEVCGTEDYE